MKNLKLLCSMPRTKCDILFARALIREIICYIVFHTFYTLNYFTYQISFKSIIEFQPAIYINIFACLFFFSNLACRFKMTPKFLTICSHHLYNELEIFNQNC